MDDDVVCFGLTRGYNNVHFHLMNKMIGSAYSIYTAMLLLYMEQLYNDITADR